MKRLAILSVFAFMLISTAGFSDSSVNKKATYQESQTKLSTSISASIDFVAPVVIGIESPEITPKVPTVSAYKSVYETEELVLNKGSPEQGQKSDLYNIQFVSTGI